MKTKILLLFLLILTAQKSKATDTIPPIITLNGNSSMYVVLNGVFVDPGATATDNQDGNITSKIIVTGSVNTNLSGTYSLNYEVYDVAGNNSITNRTVYIYNEAEALVCNYSGADTCAVSGTYSYNSSITTSYTVNKQIHIINFAGFGTSFVFNANVSGAAIGSTLSWPTQSVNSTGCPSCIIYGSTNGGTITSITPYTISLSYQWNDGTNPTETCKSKYIGSCSTSVYEYSFLHDFLIYPNPFSVSTTLEASDYLNNATLSVYNCSGQQVKQLKNISGGKIILNRDNLPRGLYFIRLTQDNKTFTTQKIVIADN